MWAWLRRLVQPRPSLWSVHVTDSAIVTADGLGTVHELPLQDFRAVVVATDGSWPWDEVMYLLFGPYAEVHSLFPLEAQGSQAFVDWLSHLPGYDDRALARAMASTAVARFVIWSAPDGWPIR